MLQRFKIVNEKGKVLRDFKTPDRPEVWARFLRHGEYLYYQMVEYMVDCQYLGNNIIEERKKEFLSMQQIINPLNEGFYHFV